MDFEALVQSKYDWALRPAERAEYGKTLMQAMIQAVLDACACMLKSQAFRNVFDDNPYVLRSCQTDGQEREDVSIETEKDGVIHDCYLVVGLRPDFNGVACKVHISADGWYDCAAIPATCDIPTVVSTLMNIVAKYVLCNLTLQDRQRMSVALGRTEAAAVPSIQPHPML